MPDIRFPGLATSFPARASEPKAEPVTIIALCDGSVTRVKAGDWQAAMHANALAADRLVERIAKRVAEMRAEQPAEGHGVTATAIVRWPTMNTPMGHFDRLDPSDAAACQAIALKDGAAAADAYLRKIAHDAIAASDGIKAAIDAAVKSAIAEYDRHLTQARG